ncbi:adenosylcobinamide-GDP ribazoletransferase [Halobacillus amylolyticus]|uniref:Adenosylcobinamide-GDP ribazoletransferase n=1 Tax=Halobacillus amylolyticus TaxID=2932259 RepID=A0ABY4H8K3_9BACI|nr:adenosylcobinamide-GDP ribazoletransferase [Halobacillus amylolyticus]UOR10876.1 adenosylcobinamide-GDP ribazoletransferase [Halobacillus amylolyticus]
MKNFGLGGLFALQFFSVFPIRKGIDPNPAVVRSCLMWLPILGLVIGGSNAFIFYGLSPLTTMSLVSLTVFALMIPAVWSGGLHLDGLMDTGDAFFSYQDQQKRLEVMQDPRTGAFGVLVLLAVLILRFVFMYESFLADLSMLWFILLIPFLSRCVMVLMLGHTPSARQKGLSYFFKNHYSQSVTVWVVSLMIVVSVVTAFFSWSHFIVSLVMGLAAMIGMWGIRRWAVRSFGGITGDVCGATLEGMETYLWFIVWLCI